jgi:hypothetical protein
LGVYNVYICVFLLVSPNSKQSDDALSEKGERLEGPSETEREGKRKRKTESRTKKERKKD